MISSLDKWEFTKAGLIPDSALEQSPTLHFCPEWDDLVIDENSLESCSCFEDLNHD